MVTIGNGRDDPRKWVQVAYVIVETMENRGPRDPLPPMTELAGKLDVSLRTVQRAYRELVEMGIIYRVDGYGYFPRPGSPARVRL